VPGQPRRLTVAFDVDGTLIGTDGEQRSDIVTLLRLLTKYCTVVVWSGGGQEYAQMQGARLALPDEVRYFGKVGCPVEVDLAFDDVADFGMARAVIVV
jgi:hypothetical protein